MSLDPYHSRLGSAWEEEGLFARDVDGQLIRVVAATQKDYDKEVVLTIDGEDVTVFMAVPSTDSQGSILNDREGRTVPRRTTIYDAVTKLFDEKCAAGGAGRHPIPTLCHQEHMSPVGVCRVCVVEVRRRGRDGTERAEERLVPACVHPVDSDMVIHTMESPDATARERVGRAVRPVVELLAADHLGGAPSSGIPNELEDLVARLGADRERFRGGSRAALPLDRSSPLIDVDRTQCILCNRCTRACNEVKANFVIGRAGKGYETRVAFDLDDPAGSSTCVSCGECMVSCPTGALAFRKPVESAWRKDLLRQEGRFEVPAEELKKHPLFQEIPLKFLQWNSGAVVGWRVRKGDLLCRQGEYGGTAFVLNRGSFAFWARPAPPPVRAERETARGIVGRLLDRLTRHPSARRSATGADVPPDGVFLSGNTIVGEMACLNSQPRRATVEALEEGEVYVIRRNLLYVLRRNEHARRQLDRVYRERALENHLRDVAFFARLSDAERRECRKFLKDRVELVRVDPGQVIFAQAEPADAFYMIRCGHVKVSQVLDSEERILRYLGPNAYFGEIGLVAKEHIAGGVPESLWDLRTATCTALDDVELVRIRKQHFRELLERSPTLFETFVRVARERLRDDQRWNRAFGRTLGDFLEQGLFNAQKLLVIDLEACTRCDRCVTACAETHGGVTRLVREGLRFDKYLVASACRSCTDPYCLVGCPVDAIHREGSLEIVIEDHCIGCGQCAVNCPYGNINMVVLPREVTGPQDAGRTRAVPQQRATTCDLCRHIVKDRERDEVSCVYACPHHAAFRLSGAELLERVRSERPGLR